MGDVSELQVLVVVGVLLSSFVFITTLIPSQFVVGIVNGTQLSLPPNFDAARLLGWNVTTDITIPVFSGNDSIHPNGYNFQVTGLGPSLHKIECFTFALWGPFIWDQDYFRYYKQGADVTDYGAAVPRLSIESLDSDYAANYSMTYSIRNSHVNFDILFVWNTTTYATPLLAFHSSQLKMVFNSVINEAGSALNGWSLVASLMSFSLTDVPSWIQYLIGVPVWIGLAYVAFIFVLRMIGAVFGGGGA